MTVLSEVRVTLSLVLYVCFVDRCLSFCTFFFWPLCCLFFFDIWILITLLVSSNSSLKLSSASATLKPHDKLRGVVHKFQVSFTCTKGSHNFVNGSDNWWSINLYHNFNLSFFYRMIIQ
jgi:hypothetical protein